MCAVGAGHGSLGGLGGRPGGSAGRNHDRQALDISEREMADRRAASELVGSRRVLSAAARRHSKSR